MLGLPRVCCSRVTHRCEGDEGGQQRAISLVVRIAAFQAVDPGSNPGWRITFCKIHTLFAFLIRNPSTLIMRKNFSTFHAKFIRCISLNSASYL